MTSGPGRPGERLHGELVVVATPIGNIGDLSPRAAAALEAADVVCCEDTRHTGQLLARSGLRASRLLSVHAHNEGERVAEVLELLGKGARVAIVSDAGTPALSDPGERVIAAAIAAGHTVTSVPGPSAAVTALVVAGLGTARWRFEGFLPRRGADRAVRLDEIAKAHHPSVIYEAPQRLVVTLRDLSNRCGGDRKVAVCRELTKRFEETWRGTLSDACERAEATPPRGEHVLVVAAAPTGARPLPSEEEIRSAVVDRMSAGVSRRQAAADVAADLGVSKRLAYESSLPRSDR
ncbi:MAG TPA: 16S rRNA (cytidine(1402)-2'-O)-methyltransferase [Acidimicrobiales bacterium]|nr:16S rRNA (cytidine(1402)-2'-O)-methyltransferase [Acidimicrobiales bacterium]